MCVKARKICATRRGSCVSVCCVLLSVITLNPQQHRAKSILNVSQSLPIRSHRLPGVVPLRPVRPRLLSVHLCRQPPRIQVSATGRCCFVCLDRLNLLCVFEFSLLPTGGVPGAAGVCASGSVDSRALVAALDHTETKGQITVKLQSSFFKGNLPHRIEEAFMFCRGTFFQF